MQLYEAVFSPAQCERIIAVGSSLPDDDAGLEGEGGEHTNDHGLRRSRTSWIPPTDETMWIFQKLGSIVERANREYRFELSSFDEDLQFTTYDRPGAFYTWHQDGLDGSVANRKLSLVVQLSDPDDYEGGDLELFGSDGDDGNDDGTTPTADGRRDRGTVVVFPSFEFHRVRPLRGGHRHSLVSWVSGPPFR